jgi:D-alanyl-D-alanine carboxypeptidase (penicillin-binding protein 5/6)
MKQKFTAFLAAVLLAALCAVHAAAAGPTLSTTEAYCIMDADSGLVLAQQNMDEELHPASITKVLTLGLACEKANGDWGATLTVSHDDVYSLAGTDSSHIALQVGEEVPLEDALYGTMMASANDGANLLAEYFGGGTIEGGVEAMNAKVAELGLAHSHFANPHGISSDDHYTSCYDMAVILRWALTQPGFETLFTRNSTYTMQPTNLQENTRYFSQQDRMRIASSKYSIPTILGSKIGYTNIARYTYVCLAEQNGVRLICVAMRSEAKANKYADVRTLLDYAFSTFTGYSDVAPQGKTQQLDVVGGGDVIGQVTVTDPGVSLLLAEGVTDADVTVELEVPERWVLGTESEAYAVYTVDGHGLQENISVRVPAQVDGLEDMLAAVSGTALVAAADVEPQATSSKNVGPVIGVVLAAGTMAVILQARRARKRREVHQRRRQRQNRPRL